MDLNTFLNKYGFELNTNIKYENNQFFYYSNSKSLKLNIGRILRKTDKFILGATHFQCTSPYTLYYLVYNNKIYILREYSYIQNTAKDIIEDLQDIGKIKNINDFDPLVNL